MPTLPFTLLSLFEDPRLRRALHLLNGGGEETRVVGGAVRNALLGRPPGDVDLATTMLPEAVMARARAAKFRAVPTGIAHGTVTLIAGGLPLEVTTLREDIETDGRHALVRFGRDFARDAERRDFTMNALSVGLDGVVHDTTGGRADIAAGRVRFIGDAATRIREDYLRILRFFRFHATYGSGPLDAEGLAAAGANRDGIARLSRERVRTEMLKLLGAPGAAAVVEAMDATGILAQVLRGPADVGRFHRLAARDADPLLRLSALAVRTPGDVERLREALRLSNAERDRLVAATNASTDLTPSGSIDLPPGAPRIRVLLFDHGHAAAADAMRLARATALGGDEGWGEAVRRADETPIPSLPFTGEDLVARGIKGPAVGRALAGLRLTFARAGFPEDAETRVALLDEALADPSQPIS